MSARRQSVVLLSLVLVDAGCARLFPASDQDDHPSRIARPRVEKTATRRREGSDVTLPSENAPNWPARILVPCDFADSAAARPADASQCQHIDQRVDTLRAPIDTATKRRP
jgi:hypothetical protein